MAVDTCEALEADHDLQARDIGVLRAALSRVPVDLEGARRAIGRIDRQLSEHIRWEEQAFYPQLSLRLGEDSEDAVDELLREHVELLVTATALRVALEQAEPPADLEVRGSRFAQLFERHARREQMLLTQAFGSTAAASN